MTGAVFQLLHYMTWHQKITLHFPSVVIEELVANHRRAVDEAGAALVKSSNERQHLGLDPITPPSKTTSDYRAHLMEFVSKTHSYRIEPWPAASHEDISKRAIERRPPFDTKGGGYRDALVWETVLALASRGGQVVLASGDSGFAEGQELHPALAHEVAALAGSVVLVRDLAVWLPSQLPWESTDVRTASARARDENFRGYLRGFPDFLETLTPEVDDLRIPATATEVEVDTVRWNGECERSETRDAGGGASWVTYDVGIQVDVSATLPRQTVSRDAWTIVSPETPTEHLRVAATIDLLAKVGVFYESDEDALERIAFEHVGQTPFKSAASGAESDRHTEQ